ncbi:MAG: sulfotransferase [Rivularia sp. T60_A2020_040]|nr:sulfotransferase [Rivularia sp. T60_A2020_040]
MKKYSYSCLGNIYQTEEFNLNSNLKPLFIFSLPRSGSTLLQRILASHDQIATVAEPWILLPYLYTLKQKGVYAEYGHNIMTKAIQDFCTNLPNQQDDYLTEVHDFIIKLYAKAAPKNTTYFLDKTPRYHLIVEEIINLFPEAKFIFLWRNPLAIIASMIESFGRSKGKWNLYGWKIDLFVGLTNLLTAHEKFSTQIYSLRYENLVSQPDIELSKLFSYLDLEINPELFSNFNQVQLKGKMGDPLRETQYQSLRCDSLEKWKQTLSNPIRKLWCRNYLNWIGKEKLLMMGYDLQNLLEEVDTVPTNLDMIASDLLRMSYGMAYSVLEIQSFKHKIKSFPCWYQMFANT